MGRTGRPRGSKDRPKLSLANIIDGKRKPALQSEEKDKAHARRKSTPKAKISARGKGKGGIGPSISFFPFTKLPQNRVVLQRYLWFREKDTSMKLEKIAGNIATELIELLWKPSGLPVMTYKSCKRRVLSVLQKYVTRLKRPETEENKIHFQAFLSQLCDLGMKDMLRRLKQRSRIQTEWEEDWKWYQQMRSKKQPGLLAGRDKVMEQRVKAKERREEGVKQRASCASFDRSQSISSSEGEEEENSEEWRCKRKPASRKRLPPEVSNTFDRLQLSYRQRAMTTAHILAATGEDISNTCLSKSALHRQAKKVRWEKAETIKNELVIPSHPIVHFDTKLVTPKGKDSEERGSVLISGGDELPQPKLLGILKLPSSKGADVAEAVLEQLAIYDVDVTTVTGVVYDTTAANSGWRSGATWRLEREIGHAVLGLECRRHVHELHVSHAAKAIFGGTKGPSKALYKELKQRWPQLDKDGPLTGFDWSCSVDFLNKKAESVLGWATDHMTSGTFPRDDYKELCSLIVTYLSGELPENYRMRRPGAASEARFLADALYVIKMDLLSSQLHLSDEDAAKIKSLAIFVVLFYAPYFLRSGLAATAAWDDLQYYREMQQLSELAAFRPIANAVLKSLERHTAYLEAAALVFVLFSEDVPEEERQKLAECLSSTPRPEVIPAGKPLSVDIRGVKNLADLVGERSWLLFNLLSEMDTSWLTDDVKEWPASASYRHVRNFVRDLAVVNDGAERGIGLLQELIDKTQDEEQLRALAQVVSWHRQACGHTKEAYSRL